MRCSGSGLGMFASEAIPGWSAFACIPFSKIVNRANLLADSALSALLQQHPGTEEHACLVLYAIHQMLLGAEWVTAGQSRTFQALPAEDVRRSGDELLIMDYQAYRQQLAAEFGALQPLLAQHPELFPPAPDYQQLFLRASDFVSTRAFGCGMKETALVPFFDCLNHGAGATVRLLLVNEHFERDRSAYDQWRLQSQPSVEYEFLGGKYDLGIVGLPHQHSEHGSGWASSSDSESEGEEAVSRGAACPYTHLVLATTAPAAPNQELRLHYGGRNNEYLLRWYGFVLQDNPYDSLRVFLSEASESLRFDPIDRPCAEVKFKPGRLCLGLLSWARKHYFQAFYGRKHGRVLWAIPADPQFEAYILERCIRRLQDHDVPFGCGFSKPASILQDYQLERRKLYRQQIQILEKLRSWLKEWEEGLAAPYGKDLEEYCRGFVAAVKGPPKRQW